jgi:hypothetical protein
VKLTISKAIVIVFLCFKTFAIFCQNNIEINIFDENQEPASYSNVVLYNNNNIIAGTTSLNGVAVLKNIQKNDYRLCITYIGYKDTCILINYNGIENLKFTINLIPDTFTLNEVNITVKKPTIKINSENNVSINIENTKLAEVENLNDLLKFVPGVIVTPTGIQVFGSSDYTYMINGKENMSQLEIDALRPEDIKEIEIITSNAKFDATKKYAINIKTIKRKDYFGIQIYDRLEYNKALHNTTRLFFIFNVNKLQQSLAFNNNFGRYKQTEISIDSVFLNQNDIYHTHFTDQNSEKFNDNYLRYAMNFDIDTNQNIGLQLYGYINDLKDIDEFESIILGANRYFSTKTSVEKSYYFQSSINYSYKMKKAGQFSAIADYYTQKSNENMNMHENQSDYMINSENSYNIYALKGDYTFPISKINTNSSFGFKLNQAENKNISIPDTVFANDIFDNKNNLIEQLAAIYFQFNSSMRKIVIEGGLRFEYYYRKLESIMQKTENKNLKEKADFFPNLSLTYNISDNHITKLNYSRNINRQAYRYISGENHYINPYLYSVANLNLEPTIIHSLSLAYIFGGFLQIHTEYSHIKNHANLASTFSDSIVIFQYQNFNKQNIEIGISVTKQANRHHTSLSMNIKKTYIDYPNEIGTLKFPKINFDVSFNNIFNITQNFTSDFSFAYRPKQQYDWIVTDPMFNIRFGLRHFFLNKSLRIGGYYDYNSINKYISQYNNYQQYHSLDNQQHVFYFTILYRFKFDQKKIITEKNSIQEEKQRIQ